MQGEKTFVHNDDDMEYVVQIKGRSYWWLWLLLLLLLPLLLLISFNKNVAVVSYDTKTNNGINNVNIGFEYVDYALMRTNPFRLFAADTVRLSGVTSQDGKITFTDVKYTLYSALFHSGHLAKLTASGGCLASDTTNALFHPMQEIIPTRLGLAKNAVDVVFKVLDKDDNQPIAGAEVEVLLDGNVNKLLTDPAGYVTVPGLEICGNVNLNAQMDGYLGDTIKCDVPTVLEGEHNRTLLLKPGRGVLSFSVQDLENQQPIPNVNATLLVNGDTLRVTTNTNGVGKGCFEDVNAKYKFTIDLKHVCYFDTLTKEYKVTEFERLSDNDRVFKMRPQKNSLIFRNIDSLTKQPISGVANQVFINGNDCGVVYSNKLGCFTIGNIGENDVLEIKSTHANYKLKIVNRKGSDVNVDNQHKRDVFMQLMPIRLGKPDPLRNCGVHFSGTLLSDESVKGHISKIYEPDLYGEYVGDGKYANNQVAFPKAVQYTFDAIAVDKGTHLTVYSKPNFEGEILLDVSGPYLINNVKWKNDARIKDFQTKTFSGDFESNYPKSCRHWSQNNMNSWDFGSVIITCDK